MLDERITIRRRVDTKRELRIGVNAYSPPAGEDWMFEFVFEPRAGCAVNFWGVSRAELALVRDRLNAVLVLAEEGTE